MSICKSVIVTSIILAFAVATGAAEQTDERRPPGHGLLDAQPRMTVSGQTAEISFAVKEYTDVAVEVVDGKGQVIRHLGSGVLGANAPAPFQKNSKSQAIAWDLKDNEGKAVGTTAEVRVLVRAGLKPTFERTIGWTRQRLGIIKGMCVDEAGQLFVSTEARAFAYRQHTHTKVFDREGTYVRTIIPFPANLPEEKLKSIEFANVSPERRIPVLKNIRNRDVHGIGFLQMHQPLVIDGRFILPTSQGGSPTLTTVGVDGSVGENFIGPRIASFDERHARKVQPRVYLAASPDRRYIYASGVIRSYGFPRHDGFEAEAFANCVYRIDRQGKEDAVPFIGKEWEKGGILSNPLGIDVDAEGNIYVCDYGKNRIAIFDSQGALQKSIPVNGPVQVAVHPAGKIYVYAADAVQAGGETNMNRAKLSYRLIRLGGKEDPTQELEMKWPDISARIQLCLALDRHSEKPILWMGAFTGQDNLFSYNGNIRKIIDNGDAFEDLGDVITKRSPDEALGREHKFVLVDPKTDEVWWDNLIFDGNTGELVRKFKARDMSSIPIGQPGRFNGEPKLGPNDSILFWADGNQLARYKRDGRPYPFSATNTHKVGFPGVAGMAGAGFSRGIHVDGQGNVYLAGPRNFREKRFNNYVHLVLEDGTLAKKDLIQINESISGIAVDRKGAIYVGAHLKNFGQRLPPPWDAVFESSEGKGKQYDQATGSVIKFSPSGGSILVDPQGEDFQSNTSRSVKIARYKATGVEWSRFITSEGRPMQCNCEVTDMEVDGHNRTFAPDPLTYSVWVYDENGNTITRFGEYGNMDSAGLDSKVPVPEIPLSYAFRLAVSDKAVYVNDTHAPRVVKVRLDYKETASINMDGTPGALPAR